MISLPLSRVAKVKLELWFYMYSPHSHLRACHTIIIVVWLNTNAEEVYVSTLKCWKYSQVICHFWPPHQPFVLYWDNNDYNIDWPMFVDEFLLLMSLRFYLVFWSMAWDRQYSDHLNQCVTTWPRLEHGLFAYQVGVLPTRPWREKLANSF